MDIQKDSERRDLMDLLQAHHSLQDRGFEASPDGSDRDDLQKYLRALLKRWWLVLAMGLVALAGAWWTERNAIPRYTAQVLLQRRTQAPMLPQGLIREQSGEFASQLELIRSRAVIRSVVDSLGLQLRLNNQQDQRTSVLQFIEVEPSAPRGSFELESDNGRLRLDDRNAKATIATYSRFDTISGPGFRLSLGFAEALTDPLLFSVTDVDQAIERLQRRLRIEQGLGSDLIWIRFPDPDPQHASDVANAVANEYKRYGTNVARQLAVRRREVVADQLVQLADSLQVVQDRLLDYQRNQSMLNPETEDAALLGERLNAEEELRTLEFQQRMLQTLVAELQTTGPNEEIQQRLLALGNDVIPGGAALQARLQELMQERGRLTASRFGYTQNAPEVQTLDALILSVQRQMKVAAEESLEVLRARIGSLETRLSQVRSGVRTAPGETAEFERLRQRVLAVQNVYDILVAQYYEAQIAEAVEAGDVAVVDAATPPLYPDPSRGPLKMMLALLAGLMVGSVSAVMLEQLDKSVSSARDVERFTQIPVLGTVPRVKSLSADSLDARLGKEAFRAIRTNIRFALPSPPKSIVVTSAEPGEGKSTVSANLAIALAEQGLRVILVDADLRRPRVHELLHMDVSPGLADVLRGHAELEEAVRSSDVLDLHVMTGGRANGNAPELVGGEGFAELLSWLEGRFDAVVIDTAPVLAFTDAALISVVADGTLVVARVRKTDGNKLREAVEKLRRVGAPLAGIVLNGAAVDSSSTYYYEYYDGEDRGPGLTIRRALPSRSSAKERA